MAQRGTDAGLRVLKVRKEAPLLVLELAVDALLLTPGRASMLPIERMLLAGIDAAYDPTQQHQHSDLTLQIVYKGKVVRGDGSQAVDERIITRRAEARTQTEARETKPTHHQAAGVFATHGKLD